MVDVLLYLIYMIGLIGSIAFCLWVHYKLEILRLKKQLLNDLIEKGYETEKIDIETYLKK